MDASTNTQGTFLFVNEEQLRTIIGEVVQEALSKVKNTPKRMYSRQEVCDIMHITLGTLDNMVKRGGAMAQAVRHIGERRVLFDAEIVDEAIASGMVRKGKHQLKGGRV